jgi:hypothetical protein
MTYVVHIDIYYLYYYMFRPHFNQQQVYLIFTLYKISIQFSLRTGKSEVTLLKEYRLKQDPRSKRNVSLVILCRCQRYKRSFVFI